MKTWRTPEMKVYNVKMDENIASSGSGEQQYEVKYLHYDLGVITRGGANYNCSADRSIQDTDIKYTSYGEENYVSNDQVGAISGCLA